MDDLEKPEPTGGDVAHVATKALLASIPGFGGAAAEIFAALIMPPLEGRRDRWVESIANGLKELRKKFADLDWDELLKSDQFITATLHATQTALKNHQKDKLEALRNAVLNAAIGANLDEDLQMVFLRYIDELTPWHLRILGYFQDPAVWLKEHGIKAPEVLVGSLTVGVYAAFPELRKEGELYKQLVDDLHARGLLAGFSDGTMTAQGIYVSRASDLGRRFVSFIQSPI